MSYKTEIKSNFSGFDSSWCFLSKNLIFLLLSCVQSDAFYDAIKCKKKKKKKRRNTKSSGRRRSTSTSTQHHQTMMRYRIKAFHILIFHQKMANTRSFLWAFSRWKFQDWLYWTLSIVYFIYARVVNAYFFFISRMGANVDQRVNIRSYITAHLIPLRNWKNKKNVKKTKRNLNDTNVQ